jgi:phosphoenolpyruvate-protein kinase (PTS system EI component)
MAESQPEIFLSQIRALLRAGAGRDLRIMIPMISSLEEVIRARALLDQARFSLDQDGLPYADQIQFGIMIEVPSAALLSNELAPSLDFFSIGTNDLTQYTLAVDRTNSRVAHLASPFHPAVLRLIQLTIQSGHAHSRWVGMCGELAGEMKAVPLLLGLGLDEFSMAPALIPAVKSLIRKCSIPACREIARKALSLPTAAEVVELLDEAVTRMSSE